jgi:hypothetical protein
MTNPYGWSVVPRLLVKRERWPGSAQTLSIPLVYPGQEVLPDQPVLRRELSPPADAASSVLQQSPLPRRTSGQLALSDSSPVAFVHSPLSSDERLNNIEFPAGLHGRVVGFTGRGGVVIESKVALVQGVLGAGNQVAGVVTMWRAGGVGYVPHAIPPGALLVVPGPLSFTLLHRALSSGVAGIIASSMALHDLEGFLRTDFLQLLRAEDVDQAQAQLPPLTLLLTEGIGATIMPAHVMNLLHHYEGSIALLSGVTSLRYDLYPELLISLPLSETQKDWQPLQPDASLALNAQVRICNGARKGAVGTIDYFFVYPQLFPSGLRTRAARLRMPDGSFFVVPYSSLERIG